MSDWSRSTNPACAQSMGAYGGRSGADPMFKDLRQAALLVADESERKDAELRALRVFAMDVRCLAQKRDDGTAQALKVLLYQLKRLL